MATILGVMGMLFGCSSGTTRATHATTTTVDAQAERQAYGLGLQKVRTSSMGSGWTRDGLRAGVDALRLLSPPKGFALRQQQIVDEMTKAVTEENTIIAGGYEQIAENMVIALAHSADPITNPDVPTSTG